MNRGPGPAALVHAASDFRPEVQGLRAVAVLLVVIYHLAPNRLSGGYVGVDVFFVISGYLITLHLAQEAQRTGRIRVVRFWARRVRRLLPASLLVLLVSLLMVWLWVPQTDWNSNIRQVIASALYVQNWALMRDAVDYSAMGEAASVAQHYWSLSVEEQFYLFWPVAIVTVLGGWGRARRRREPSATQTRRSLLAMLVLIFAVSLVWSVVATGSDPGAAYFQTFTRVWEFALGGLIGLCWNRDRLRGPGGAALAWMGIAGMLAAAVLYDQETLFPGWAALLPVLGAAAVLAGGHSDFRMAPRWLTWRPAIFVGDISYAIYLWHWPLIVVTPHVIGHELDLTARVAILALTFALAWSSTRFVEDPLRSGWLLRPIPRVLAIGAVAMAVVVAGALVLREALPEEQPFVRPALSSCVGPGALDPANRCPSATGGPARPGPVQVARQNREEVAYPGCMASFKGTALTSCHLGLDEGSASLDVALVGDSHATAWFSAFDDVAQTAGWSVRTYAKTSCPVTFALRVLPAETDPDHQSDCAAWVRRLDREIRADGSLDAVVVAAYSTAYSYTSPDDLTFADPDTDGFVDIWAGWRDAGLQVIVLADVPRTNGDYVPTCLAAHEDPTACAVPREQGLPDRRPITDAGRRADGDGIHLLDLTDRFCDEQWCYPQVGSVIVYRDYSHLSKEYGQALAPEILRRLPVLTDRGPGE